MSGTLSEGFLILNKMQEEFLEEGEEWRDIIGCEGRYMVSSHGRIMSLDRIVYSQNGGKQHVPQKIKSLQNDTKGYKSVTFILNKKKRRFPIHRLVAIAFIPNPENKPQVNHIDGNKHNNYVSNLEWNTAYENMHHAWRTGLSENPTKGHFLSDHPLSKSVDVYEVCIRKLGSYGSYIEAAASANKSPTAVTYAFNVKPKTIKDFVFVKPEFFQAEIGDVFVWTDVLPIINTSK